VRRRDKRRGREKGRNVRRKRKRNLLDEERKIQIEKTK
jgi:hypothetical protein